MSEIHQPKDPFPWLVFALVCAIMGSAALATLLAVAFHLLQDPEMIQGFVNFGF